MPKSANKDFPQPLTSLKSLKYVEMQYHDLLKACESVSLNITQKMVECVEAAARDQSKSKLWYKYRAGRITASRMKAVCYTDAAKPSQSLIKGICYLRLLTLQARPQIGVAVMRKKLEQSTQERAKANIMIFVSQSVVFLLILNGHMLVHPQMGSLTVPKGVLELFAIMTHQYKLQLQKTVSSILKNNLMVNYTWIKAMHIITRYKHNYLSAM